MANNGNIIDTNHHCVTSASLVKEICYPFFCDTDITNFVYARIFDNNEIYSLNSSEDWQLLHLNSDHLVTPPIPNGIPINKRGCFMLTLQTAPELFLKTMNMFQKILKMDYPYFIIERYSSFYDLYVFCTHVGNQDIINFYLNQQSYIEKFKHFFHEKSKNLLKDAQRNKICVPNTKRPALGWEEDYKKNDIDPKEYIIFIKNKTIRFTAKEAQCLKYLSLGYTAKAIANKMAISPRTVEFHINNIKRKVGFNSISTIITFLRELEVPLQLW